MTTAKSVWLEVPFEGRSELLADFYKILGVPALPGGSGVVFEKVEILLAPPSFPSASEAPQAFQFAIEIDGDLDLVEEQISTSAGKVIDSGFDTSGPFIVAQDPAGLKLRIYLSQEALLRAANAAPP